MADTERENVFGFVDKREVQSNGGSLPGFRDSNIYYNDVSRLRTQLAAVNAAYYTTARLNNMTKNDMVYALRVSTGDVAGI